MKPTIECGKHLATKCRLTGSRFDDVCLGDAEFENVNLSGASFDNINLSHSKFHNISFADAEISAVNLGGATFRHIGPPLNDAGVRPPQNPVSFVEADLNGSIFRDVDLSNVEIENCNVTGMKIDGIEVSDLLRAYQDERTTE